MARGGARSDLKTHVADMFISASVHSVARWEMSKYRTKPRIVVFRLNYRTRPNQIKYGYFCLCLENLQVSVGAFAPLSSTISRSIVMETQCVTIILNHT